MIWGYLFEYWDEITGAVASTTENLISYPIEFFQNIGNAVGGAIGSIFDGFFHTFSDITLFFSWAGDMLGAIFSKLALPFTFIYSFFKNIYSFGFATPPEPELTYVFATSTMEVFEAIPYWSTISMVLGVGLIIFTGLAVFKLIIRI